MADNEFEIGGYTFKMFENTYINGFVLVGDLTDEQKQKFNEVAGKIFEVVVDKINIVGS